MNERETNPVRLQKYLSDAGVASRRHGEALILEGRVRVNGKVVDELPAFVTPGVDDVRVDGQRVRPQRLEHFVLHKPKGVVCTNNDPGGRIRAVDLLPTLPVRLFPVGRLDADSTGLLLMTNDGELAQHITHPRFGIAKTYRAEIRGRAPDDLFASLKKGVYLAEGRAQASNVEVVHTSNERSILMITLREGRNRQVRRMFARLGFPVRELKRVQIGPISLRGLPYGAARRLSEEELDALRSAVAAARTEADSDRGLAATAAARVIRAKQRRRQQFIDRAAEGRQSGGTAGSRPSRSTPRPGSRSGSGPSRAESQAESRPGSRVEGRPGSRPGTRPGSRPGTPPRSRPGSRPKPRSKPRPAPRIRPPGDDGPRRRIVE